MAKQQRRSRKQRGGNGFAFSGPAAVSASGVPFESRGGYDHCGPEMRAAPDVSATGAFSGGSLKNRSRKQRGGSCNCWGGQAGGGAGTGGYSFILDNSLGKVYADLPKGTCGQSGGGSSDAVVSYSSGYGFSATSPFSTSSAHFLEPQSYDRTCAGGARSRKALKGSRKARKGSRKARSRTARKGSRKAQKGGRKQRQ